MSKRADETALSVFPHYTAENMDEVIKARKFIRQGYEQAEKDLALTVEDMERIHTFLYAIKNNKSGAFTFTRLSDEQYQEAIRRYNEWREKK